jgi:hypothetical protein
MSFSVTKSGSNIRGSEEGSYHTLGFGKDKVSLGFTHFCIIATPRVIIIPMAFIDV